MNEMHTTWTKVLEDLKPLLRAVRETTDWYSDTGVYTSEQLDKTVLVAAHLSRAIFVLHALVTDLKEMQ